MYYSGTVRVEGPTSERSTGRANSHGETLAHRSVRSYRAHYDPRLESRHLLQEASRYLPL